MAATIMMAAQAPQEGSKGGETSPDAVDAYDVELCAWRSNVGVPRARFKPGQMSVESTALIVDAESIRKTYRNGSTEIVAVEAASLCLKAGEFVALTGPSGCGKSTLLNMLACVEVPTAGVLRIAGRATGSLGDDELTSLRRTAIGYVFQFFNLMPMLTVRENVALPLLLSGWARRRIRPAVAAALQAVGLRDQAEQRPATLSGGQQQRAAIARAIIHSPKLVLADEPTGNLDTRTGTDVLTLLRRMQRDRDLTVLMATHNADAAHAADRIIRMRDGKIEAH
ncbi:MAG: ABC transporter ATP-binding protein [Candidatus Eremiobacter antarcticus]